MAKQPEGKFAKRAIAYLEGRGAWVFKVHGGDNPFQQVGIPDLLICYRGRFAGIELKQPDEKPSARQKHVMRLIEEAGGITAVAENLDQVEAVLTRLDRLTRK